MLIHPPEDRIGKALLARFLVFFSIVLSGIFIIFSFSAYQRFEQGKNSLRQSESSQLTLAYRIIARDIHQLVVDLRNNASTQLLKDYLQDPTPGNKHRLQQDFQRFVGISKQYDQLRYLDITGHERVRINFVDGQPQSIPANQLQDKSERYYFQAGLHLSRQQIYLSPMDLNMERGEIEIPHKPMIRAVIPIFDQAGERRGVLVLNYLASVLLDHFRESLSGSSGEVMLLNRQGYWLYRNDGKDLWGFMFNNEDHRFDSRFSRTWKTINGADEGQVETADGMFTYINLVPEAVAGLARQETSHNGDMLRLVTRIQPDQLAFSPWHMVQNNPRTSIWLVLMTAAISFLLAWLRTNNLQKTDSLEENERNLEEAQKLAHVGNWVLDIATGELSWSDEIYRIFGITPGEFKPSYDEFLQFVHPDDREALKAAVNTALEDNVSYRIEHRVVQPGGEIRYVEERAIVESGRNGNAGRMLGTVQDITETRQAEEGRRESEYRMRQLFENASDGIFISDMDGRYIDVNSAGCHMLGYTREELLSRTILDLIPVADVERLWKSREQLLHGDSDVDEWRLLCKNGEYLPVEVSARILPDGRWQGFVRDISERKLAEEQLRQAAAVYNNTMESIIITDANRNVVAVNSAFTKITGYEAEEVIGLNPRFQRSGRHDPSFYQDMWQSLNDTGQWQGEIWNRRKNGEIYPAWENISEVKNEQGELTHYISVQSDISSLKQAEERLSHLAYHDPLTGLVNRLAFVTNLEKTIERARRHQQKLALLFIDLDQFKLINDTLGHTAGDKLLKEIAQRLNARVRSEDMVARLGGDEFTITLAEISHAEDAALLAEELLEVIARPVQLDTYEVVTTASIGISVFPDDADNVGDLAKAADSAMYRSKSKGRNTFEFYTRELTSHAMQRLEIENDLRKALARDELVLHYQPQVDINSGTLVGLEALVRWQHPKMGLMMPDQFIGIAEETSLIDGIGEWVLHEVCRQASAWNADGLQPVRLAVNLSGHQVLYEQAAETVERVLTENNLKPGDIQLQLEITETILQSGQKVVDALNQLRNLGLSIAIDDFGTGYSSLSQLKQLPIDTLKIDRIFLNNVPADPDNHSIVSAVIPMSHNLGLKVIAEGIETIQQLNFLHELGCDEAQGFLISQAVPPEQVERFLRQEHQLHYRELLVDPQNSRHHRN